MPQDPTFTATLLNMIVTGCQMHGNVFTMMNKGTPVYTIDATGVVLELNDGTYTISVAYAEPVAKDAPPA